MFLGDKSLSSRNHWPRSFEKWRENSICIRYLFFWSSHTDTILVWKEEQEEYWWVTKSCLIAFLLCIPYVHHYNLQFVYFLPHFILWFIHIVERLILQTIYVPDKKILPFFGLKSAVYNRESNFKSRGGYNGMHAMPQIEPMLKKESIQICI